MSGAVDTADTGGGGSQEHIPPLLLVMGPIGKTLASYGSEEYPSVGKEQCKGYGYSPAHPVQSLRRVKDLTLWRGSIAQTVLLKSEYRLGKALKKIPPNGCKGNRLPPCQTSPSMTGGG